MAAGAEHSQLQRAARTTLGRLPCGAEPLRARRSGEPNILGLSPRGSSLREVAGAAGRTQRQREGCWDSGKDAETQRRMRGSGKDARTAGRMAGQQEGWQDSGKDAMGREGARLRALPGRAAQPPPLKFGGRSIASGSSSPPLPSHQHDFAGPCKAWHDKMLFSPLAPFLSPSTRGRAC